MAIKTQPAGATSRLITKAQAHAMVRPTNRPVLDAGHEVTVRPGVTLRRVQSGAAMRYRLTEKK